jgi:predicted phage terminase large subunit-like protein
VSTQAPPDYRALVASHPELIPALDVKVSRWVPQEPTPKQAAALYLQGVREILYGGSAGGGKSSWLLMEALKYVDTPGYSALVLRRTLAALALPNSIMARARQWLAGTPAKWNDDLKTYTFPSGATLTFGYLDHASDLDRYQGAELQCVCFDEATQFEESMYRYLFSRLRRLKGSEVPIRMRAASNPGGIGHDFIKQRFLVEGPSQGRVFVPARLTDNPHLDQEEYERSLQELDPITRAQLLNGDWSARVSGGRFRREWFHYLEPDEVPRGITNWCRYWDTAATEAKPGKDPDYTVGVKMGEKDGRFYVTDVVRIRETPKVVEDAIRATAAMDGHAVEIDMEQEPGASGLIQIDHYAREVLTGYTFRGIRSTGSKEVRANPYSAAVQNGNVFVVRAPWTTAFVDEHEAFPHGAHDDAVDSSSGAFAHLASVGPIQPVARSVRALLQPGYDPEEDD